MNCRHCNASLDAGEKFCTNCGEPVGQFHAEASRFCTECGSALQSEEKFCTSCGTAVFGDDVPEPPAKPVVEERVVAKAATQPARAKPTPVPSHRAEVSAEPKEPVEQGAKGALSVGSPRPFGQSETIRPTSITVTGLPSVTPSVTPALSTQRAIESSEVAHRSAAESNRPVQVAPKVDSVPVVQPLQAVISAAGQSGAGARVDEAANALVAAFKARIADKQIYVRGNIPGKKLRGALEVFGGGEDPDDVLVLVDNTVWGSAKDGLLITRTHLRAHDIMEAPRAMPLRDINTLAAKVELLGQVLLVNGVSFFTSSIPEKETLAQMIPLLNDYVAAIRG